MPNDGEVLSGVPGANAAIVLPKRDVEDPVQLILDAPVTSRGSQRFQRGDTRSGADVEALLQRRLFTDGALGFDEHQGLQALPLLQLRDAIDERAGPAPPDLLAPVTLLVGRVEVHRFEQRRILPCILEDGGHVGGKRRLIVFDGKQVVSLCVHDLGRDVLLTAHCVNRDQAALELK